MLNIVALTIIILLGLALFATLSFYVCNRIKKRRTKKFLAINPQAASIYIVAQNHDGIGKDVTVKKINGKRPYTFTYFRLHGVYVLPGTHEFTLEYSTFQTGDVRYRPQSISSAHFTVEANKRYALLFSNNNNVYTLTALPAQSQMDEHTLVTYLDEKAQKYETITAELLAKDFPQFHD